MISLDRYLRNWKSLDINYVEWSDTICEFIITVWWDRSPKFYVCLKGGEVIMQKNQLL